MLTEALVIDTREPDEYRRGHVASALNIPPADFVSGAFRQRLRGVAQDRPIILYCRSGARSHTCSQFLTAAGFTNLTNGINQGRVEKLLRTRATTGA